MTEAEFQDAVAELAQLLGYRVFHARPARTGKGYRTPVQYDGAGFVDLVMVGRGRVLFVELKSDRGRVTASQREWIDALEAAGAEVFVWRPRDWTEVEQKLRRRL